MADAERARRVRHPRARHRRPCAASSTTGASSRSRPPTLQPIYGGAAARPFVTHHNALDRDLYLRIATELYLKRCIVGGLEKVYELGKDFRNEGVSHKHNPEFTMVETYEAYADYRDVMDMLEQMVATAAARGDRGHDGALEGRGDRLRAALAAGGLPRRAPRGQRHRRPRPRRRDALRAAMRAAGLDAPTASLGQAGRRAPLPEPRADPDPAHDPPRLPARALAVRQAPSPDDPAIVERFEAFAGGMEIANAFTELNDPDDQRERFAMAAADRAAGDDEAQPMDEEFLDALEHGMPPDGRPRARHRPPGHAPDRPPHDPRGHPLPGHEDLSRAFRRAPAAGTCEVSRKATNEGASMSESGKAQEAKGKVKEAAGALRATTSRSTRAARTRARASSAGRREGPRRGRRRQGRAPQVATGPERRRRTP